MRYYETPVITGSVEQQLEQIKEHLFIRTQELNHNLEMTTAEGIWRQTLEAVQPSSPESNELDYDEEMMRRGEYVSLKGLILKAATEVIKYETKVTKEYNAEFLAKSEFGEYVEKTKLVIDENSKNITETYDYATQIKTAGKTTQDALDAHKQKYDDYTTKLDGYIKRGILDDTTSSPIFGMEIGYWESTFTYNDKTYPNNNPSKIRITPDRIGFYNGSKDSKLYEVAYISEQAFYFPEAHITGGSIGIGLVTKKDGSKYYNFEVTNTGALTAYSAKIVGGDVEITSGKITIGKKFEVKNDGSMTAASATITSGNVEIIQGSIKIGEKTKNDGSKYFNFEVNEDGAVTAYSAKIVGGDVEITSGSITIGTNFSVTSKGKMTAASAKITSGNIEITQGKIQLGKKTGTDAAGNAYTYYNFDVTSNGVLTARSGSFSGKIEASSGDVGGFTITGASGGVFWPASLAAVIEPKDDPKQEYVVFLRGNYDKYGNDYGALDTTHNFIGIKKRAKSSSSWENDTSPYLFSVSVAGNLKANTIESADSIIGKYLEAKSSQVLLGGTDYARPINLYTTGDISIGKYNSKAANIYVIAKTLVRIGQHSRTSEPTNGEYYPSTAKIHLEAQTEIKLGSSTSYCPETIYLYAGTTHMSSDFFPVTSEDQKLGDSDKRWGALYTKYITGAWNEIVIGTRGTALTFTKDIYIRSTGILYLGQDANPFSEAYLVASSKIRVGAYNDTLKTTTVNIAGTTITVSGKTITIGGSGATVNIAGTTITVSGKTITIGGSGATVNLLGTVKVNNTAI